MQVIRHAIELQQLRARAPQLLACHCSIGTCTAWESLPEERWPSGQMARIATLRDPDLNEPTFEERHPAGTRYGSPCAPVAIHFFPYNRCDVWQCRQCQRQLLRYTEYGGYYVDQRVRELAPGLDILE